MHFHGPIVRPATDANSLFIEVTAGCSHNSCAFCNFYEGTPFWVAPLSQIEEDLQEAKENWPDARDIWASGGDPFVLSTEKQIAVWDLIRKYYPDARLSTYATVADFRDKTVEDIKRIKAHWLDDLVLGIESGDDAVLTAMNKGYQAAEIVEACGKMDAAGLPYRSIYLGGLAGAGKLEESARKSAAIWNQIHPYYMYLTNVALLPGTELAQRAARGEFQEASERERLLEIRTLLENFQNPITVDTVTSTSSILMVARLPKDRQQALAKVDQLLLQMDDVTARRLQERRHRMRTV